MVAIEAIRACPINAHVSDYRANIIVITGGPTKSYKNIDLRAYMTPIDVVRGLKRLQGLPISVITGRPVA